MNFHKACYQILDLGLSLETDSTAFLELFNRDYGWFEVVSTGRDGGSCHGKPLNVSVSVVGSQDSRVVRINDRVISLRGHPAPDSHACRVLLRGLFESMDDYLVLHAGVVARDDQAVIISGAPGSGKSTLVMKLLTSGFTFFSDDFCPIHKRSSLVHPFPRSLWISPQFLEGDIEASDLSDEGIRGKKVPVRPRKLPWPVGDKPCRPKCIICLDPGGDSDGYCELLVGLKGENGGGLIYDLRRLREVEVEDLNTGLPEYHIRYPVGQGLAKKIENLLEKHEEQIWNVSRLDGVSPDFAKEPVMAPISIIQAAFQLLRELKQRPAIRGCETTVRETPAGLFAKLAQLLDGVSCYTLSTGRLEAMQDLLLSTVGDSLIGGQR